MLGSEASADRFSQRDAQEVGPLCGIFQEPLVLKSVFYNYIELLLNSCLEVSLSIPIPWASLKFWLQLRSATAY